MLLGLVGAVLIGVSLGLLGSGGSILTVPVLVYLLGQEEKVAIAGSLGIVGLVALAGALPHAWRRNVSWNHVLWFGLPGMAGTYGGAYLSQFVSGVVQLGLFAAVMLLASGLMIRPPELETEAAAGAAACRARWKIVADGLLVGVLTGLVGVGGGFLIVPALVLLGGLDMRRAVGTSLLIIAMKSGSGFYKYLGVLDADGLALDWPVLGMVSGVAICGTVIGGRAGKRLPQAVLRRVFGWFLIVMALYILLRSVVFAQA